MTPRSQDVLTSDATADNTVVLLDPKTTHGDVARRLAMLNRHARISASKWAAIGFAVALLVVEGVIAAESWRGLTGFAAMIGITGVSALGVPVTLDGVSLAAAMVALRAELAAESSLLARLVLVGFTGASAAANWWHAQHANGTEAALYLGGMSVAVAVMFNLALRQIRHESRRAAGRITAQLPKFSGLHWVRYPRLTFTAWSLAIRDGHQTSREAIDAVRASAVPPLELDSEALAALQARDRLAVAFGALGRVDVPAALAMLRDKGAPVDQSYAYQVRRAMGLDGRAAVDSGRDGPR